MKPLRVLLLAESANPEWVSVPLVGWCHARAVAQLADCHLVTQIRNRDAILRTGLPESQVTFIDNEAVARPLYRIGSILSGGSGKGWTTQMAFAAIAYPSFERAVWRKFGERIRGGEFAVVHRITPLSPSISSRLATWCRKAGVPFVVGPLNGGVPWPKGFDRARRREMEWLSYVRSAYKLLPGFAAMRRNAAALLMGSRTAAKELPARYQDRAVYIPENAVDAASCDLTSPLRPRRPGPLRIVFVGRLVPLKGVDMLIRAAADLLRAGKVELEIVGDGPERQQLVGLTVQLGLGMAVRFAGWRQHAEVAQHLEQADVLGFPSVREFGGGAVLEAMSRGVVPVVLDYGGPGELVSAATGFALPIGSRDQIVARFRDKLTELAADPAALAPMRQAARQRVQKHFTWEAKARQILQVYRWVQREGPKPDFGMPLAD